VTPTLDLPGSGPSPACSENMLVGNPLVHQSDAKSEHCSPQARSPMAAAPSENLRRCVEDAPGLGPDIFEPLSIMVGSKTPCKEAVKGWDVMHQGTPHTSGGQTDEERRWGPTALDGLLDQVHGSTEFERAWNSCEQSPASMPLAAAVGLGLARGENIGRAAPRQRKPFLRVETANFVSCDRCVRTLLIACMHSRWAESGRYSSAVSYWHLGCCSCDHVLCKVAPFPLPGTQFWRLRKLGTPSSAPESQPSHPCLQAHPRLPDEVPRPHFLHVLLINATHPYLLVARALSRGAI
jgi:hypothetical protein